MANSTERSFSIISGYDFDKTYDGIAIPPRWQRWETAHIYRISSVMENPSTPARLLSYGCNVRDPDVFSNGEDPWPDPSHLNCTETCADPALMYASPENLWNCMTLATVAMMVVPGNDTVEGASLREAVERFNFGSLEAFNALNVFRDVRECAWASCSDSKYGRCTSSLHRFKCTAISPRNIESFGNVMKGPYCAASIDGIDLDIAGQGVVISYFIQYVLVFTLGLCFKVVTTWFKGSDPTSIGSSSKHKDDALVQSPWRKAVSESRFVVSVTSTMVDLQEAQTLFAAVISVATIAAFSGTSGTGLANILTLFSWIFNHNISVGLVTAGMYPILLVQLLLNERRPRWWYTTLLVVLNWILMIVATQGHEVDDIGFERHLKETSGVEQCGGNPGPMSYCREPHNKSGMIFLPITRRTRFIIHLISAFLVVDWIIWVWQYWRNNRSQKVAGPGLQAQAQGIGSPQKINSIFVKFQTAIEMVAKFVWPALELLTFAMMILSLYELTKLMSLHTGENAEAWSFGQLVAVAVWLPVIFKLGSLIIGE